MSTDPRVERLMLLADNYAGHAYVRVSSDEHAAREALRTALSQALGDEKPVAQDERLVHRNPAPHAAVPMMPTGPTVHLKIGPSGVVHCCPQNDREPCYTVSPAHRCADCPFASPQRVEPAPITKSLSDAQIEELWSAWPGDIDYKDFSAVARIVLEAARTPSEAEREDSEGSRSLDAVATLAADNSAASASGTESA